MVFEIIKRFLNFIYNTGVFFSNYGTFYPKNLYIYGTFYPKNGGNLSMTSVKNHLNKIKEHIEELEDAIRTGIEKRASTIGFHVSSCSVDLLESYLHKTGRIPLGKIIKHEWFKRPKLGQKTLPIAERNLPFDFPKKKEIFEEMYAIEEIRNKLIYGKSSVSDIKTALSSFERLKAIILNMLGQDGLNVVE